MKSAITKPTGRKPMRIGALLLKEVPYKNEWRIQATWRDPDRRKQWFNNWRHAEEFAAKENKRLDVLKEKGAGRYTVNDAIDSYLEKMKGRTETKGKADYSLDSFVILQGIIEKHLRPKFGSMRLAEISSRNVDNWVLERRKTYKTRTVRGHLAELNRVLNHAVKCEMLVVNPLMVSKVVVSGKIDKRAKIPDRSALEALREYLNGPRPLRHSRFAWSCTRMVVLLAVSCGLRAGEASALTWDDINPETGEIDINKARGRLQGLKGPKTDAGNRKVPTTPAVREIINQHAEVYKEHYGKCVGPVLRSNMRDYMSGNRISHVFKKVMRECGLVDPETNQIKFTHHASRHWTASHWLKSTGDIHLTKTWMGHKNASMTMDIYGHCIDNPEARAKFERMPDWLIAPVEIDSPSAAQPVEITEPLRALPAPEDSFEFSPKATGPVEPDCTIDVPDIAEPWVKPFIKLLQQGMPVADACFEIVPQIPNLATTKNPRALKLERVCRRVQDEFRRLKLPGPKVIAARMRDERILKLHGQKHQTLDVARLAGCSPSHVDRVLRSRHKVNANNPLNRKIKNPRPQAREPQPEHKIQLKLL